MTILDASAVLAFLQGEPGSEIVESHIDGAVIGAANWSEVTQKVLARGADWNLAKALLTSYGVHIEPVLESDAECAAALWNESAGLSLGDRLCLALGERLDQQILTADRAWGQSDHIRQIR